MNPLLQALQFLVAALAGWINQQQRDVIHYLQEENRVLREQIAPRRLRFTDGQRRRLAAKAKALGRRVLKDLDTLVTPDTLLAWHRRLIAQKYDGSTHRRPGRPRVMDAIRQLIVLMATANRDWGLHAHPRRAQQSGLHRLTRDDCHRAPRARARAVARAPEAHDLARVSGGALGRAGRGRFLYRRGVAPTRAHPVHGAGADRARHPASGRRGHHRHPEMGRG